MDLGWIEFSVILGCGLVGFFVVGAFLERRQLHDGSSSSRQKNSQADTDDPSKEGGPKDANTEKPSLDRHWWEILGVNKEASSDDIKAAFRKEIGRYHPDRVEGLGIELRDLAEQKAKEINWAYSVAKKERRFS